MPVIETQIQHKEIMPFFCRRVEEGGLGYRETSANIVSNDLFIPSQLQEFLEVSSPMAWKALLQKYHHDNNELLRALTAFIRERILSAQNVACFFNNNKSVTFEGETLQLFYVSGTEISGNTDFSRNIFSAVEEMPHNIVCDGITLQRLRPDITIFLNGIYLGYIELKSVTNGQTARDKGRGKIISDYLESVKGIADRERVNEHAIDERRSTLYMFEKAIHLVATDVNETFVMRNIAQFFDDAHRGFIDRTASVTSLRPDMEKMFKIYPISSKLLSETQRFTETMQSLYSKRNIEKEILYYNFTQFKYAKKEKGKERVNHHGVLISPRPKQKFGCDKIIARVQEMLQHEKEPNFYLNKLRKELQALSVPEEKIEEILAQRDRFCNNKYVYSLLMQYAAGFGKSNIIGWTALQLKDLRHEGVWAFDKIMIVVDRLQLRDQIDTMMQSMNIDKSMFVEVTDQPTFVKALTDTRRIIVVNIQKFMELQAALTKAGKSLKQMRVAFLIDEIHRSNTGENNREMIDLFEKLQESMNVQAQDGGEIKKKNLIVGFTATPTEKVLARFGEFKSASIIPTWVPFDSYTMKEAINDGYILDPTKHIIPVSTALHFDTPEEFDPTKDQTITIDKTAIYANPERQEMIAQFVVNRLVSLVYGKIGGTGKAMLAVSSIPNAISYCNRVRRLMEQKCQEPNYRRYKDAPVSIVYSDNQEHESSASMNDGVSEEKVIQNFKLAKNGLIIVVDKLQTGFDEPKLHTLFLDKEITDVNAIQTISRVNRTCKYKEECHIVDLSWKNVNISNIKEAFKKYCGITMSDFNPDMEAQKVKMLHDVLWGSEPAQRWFKLYRKLNNDTTFVLQMEDGIRQWIKLQFERTAANDALSVTDEHYLQVVNEAKELRKKVGQYGAAIMMLEDVLDIDAKYREGIWLHFWEIYCRIYRDFIRASQEDPNLHPIIDVIDEVPGITISAGDDEDEDDDEDGDDGGTTTVHGGSGHDKYKQDVLALIKAWNDAEQLTLEEIEKWAQEIGRMFSYFMEDQKFMAVIQDNTFAPDLKQHEYVKIFNRYLRVELRKRTDLEKVELLKRMLDENKEQLLDIFLETYQGVLRMEFGF